MNFKKFRAHVHTAIGSPFNISNRSISPTITTCAWSHLKSSEKNDRITISKSLFPYLAQTINKQIKKFKLKRSKTIKRQ